MRFPKHFAPVVAAAVLWLQAGAAEIDPDRYLEHVKYLASDELKGRGTGTPELDRAAAYIAEQFKQAGVRPPAGQPYLQPLPVTTNAKLSAGNRFASTAANGTRWLKVSEDFIPFNFSASGEVSGGVVFAGYGITAPEYNYDDYAGIDAKGKIVLVLRHEPQEHDERSVFAGKGLTEHAQFWSKAVNAKRHGAAAVVLINDVHNHRGDADDLQEFGRTVGPSNAGIPFLQVKAHVAERWFHDAGKPLEQIHEAIDKGLRPQSFAFPGTVRVQTTVRLKREVKTVNNIAAYVPGRTDEYIVIGAHYDHLGLGEQFSMSATAAGRQAHPGADDNASGTAGILELARYFASRPEPPRRGILFLAFAAEELGLLGSRYYVDNPCLPLDKAVAMINLDMIGRVRDSKVYIGGAETGSTLKSIVEEVVPKHNVKPDYSGSGGYGSSDHTSFMTKQIPVLFFFSGLHGDYHRPSDTWDKIDAPGAAELLEVVANVAEELIDAPQRPAFVKVKAAAPSAGGGAGGGGGYGAWFGSIPDFGETPKGVKFAGVSENSPAAKAGLKAGDTLVEFDGKPVDNLYDFTYALREKKPGDTVKVKVLRGGETVDAEVRLEKRK